jgi:NadR type nicotinamide-nucleotide adenylyltransferase
MAAEKRGLTLGKFAPFHKGHQLLIDTALSEMDEVIVIIYDCPETTSVPLNVRSNWIRTLYREVKVIEAWDGPTEVGDTPSIMQSHENYVLNKLKLKGITHFYSSEFYGEHMSKALGAVNRIVDQDRTTVPTCGATIRENPFAFREYLDPQVYRDLIANVVFIGAPSSGKTAIAMRLAQEYNTVWAPESGRECRKKNQVSRRLSLDQLVEIAEDHLKGEEALLYQANRFLFTDTNAVTTYIISRCYHDMASQRLVDLANRAVSRYDVVFVCDINIPRDDTWDRSEDESRRIFQKQLLGELAVRKVPFFHLRGSLEMRVQRVKSILDGYHKYTNTLDLLRFQE